MTVLEQIIIAVYKTIDDSAPDGTTFDGLVNSLRENYSQEFSFYEGYTLEELLDIGIRLDRIELEGNRYSLTGKGAYFLALLRHLS